jgi:predicted NUDIX family phosphoesterase
LSIGLGGHIDEAPQPGEPLMSLILREAWRELEEEAGLGQGPIHFVNLIADTDDVGCVHCGILGYRSVSREEKDNLSPEAGCIEKGAWLTIEELKNPSIYPRLEGWSKLAVDSLDNYFRGATTEAITPETGKL